MNWINLNVATLDSEEFLGAEPEQRATWLCLLRYCAGQENGGRIPGAKTWTDRKWLQVVRVSEREIATTCELWWWEGDDLIVKFYPNDKESHVKRLRSLAKERTESQCLASQLNGLKGGRPKRKNPAHDQTETQQETREKPGEVEEEREEERKGNENENEKPSPPPPGGGCGQAGSDEAGESDAAGETHVLPRRWQHIPRSDRRNHRVHANNRVMQRIGTWFGRKPGSLWNLAEGIALSQLAPPRDDVDLLERYYLAPLERKDDYRRRDLITLLNNWHGELDRARIWEVEMK